MTDRLSHNPEPEPVSAVSPEDTLAANGMAEMGVYIDGAFVGDGHHRILAARALGLASVPLETEEDARARWVRDHGCVDWEHRKFGDV